MSLQPQRLTIGLLINQLDEEYHSSLWNRIEDIAEARDVNLIVFVGKCIAPDQFIESQENVVYSMVDTEMIDGFILSSGTLANYLSDEEYARFVRRFTRKPVVSIAVQVPDVPSICIDNKSGLKSVLSHLVHAHGFRKIAFASGSENNAEARIRYDAYCEALAEHDIPYDPALVVPCDFTRESGKRAVEILIDERHIGFEAIAAANDAIAIGVLDELRERGIRVPHDVALTGFDDIIDARFASPPLTSVHMPIREIAHKGTEMLLELINGKKVPDLVRYPAPAVIRQSCGCLPVPKQENREEAGRIPSYHDRGPVRFDRDDSVVDRVIAALQAPQHKIAAYRKHTRQLLSVLYREIETGNNAGSFLNYFDELLNRTIVCDADPVTWHDAVYLMKCLVVPSLKDQMQALLTEEILHQAQILTGNAYARRDGLKWQIHSSHDRYLGLLFASIGAVTDEETLLRIISGAVRHFGIREFYVAYFDERDIVMIDRTAWRMPETSRLVLAVERNQVSVHTGDDYGFPTRKLVPMQSVPKEVRFSWMVRIVYSRERRYGFSVMNVENRLEHVFSTLHDMIGTGCLLSHADRRHVASVFADERAEESGSA